MNLQNLNVTELSAQEVQETEGGNPAGLLLAVALYVISDWDSIEAGWKDASAGKEPNYDPCSCR